MMGEEMLEEEEKKFYEVDLFDFIIFDLVNWDKEFKVIFFFFFDCKVLID